VSANVNKVILIGNLTRDPELRTLQSGTAVCEFGLAINRKWRGKDGQQSEDTCFVDLQAWAKAAEVITEYVHKGDPLYVEGRLKLDSWEGRDGTKRSKLRVVVEQFQFLGGRRSGTADHSARTSPARPAQAGQAVLNARDEQADAEPPEDESIPF